ncbi:MAG TPA: bacillithiol system redox-active protein YtxJ [Flavobacterium sp.]|uniref:bacillithiol system redox-active protein YtxJ n=1 Tax=Flavobacterium sp. TaxID=239 RepID=UPI002DBF83BF|nr:bacillithiol system redox-active protein YtxJ [Flavobacterium sp.]HEU4791149.1 bacillithiol system redox-active protein YtxJ [Flavobacterium sp.]
MSIFNSLFGDSEEKKETINKINWIPLTNLGQLNEIVALSNEKPVAIFKHSTRCSVSRFALKQFENGFALEDKVDAYFLDLIEYRDVSNEIANRFQVVHQSPQLLLIKNGQSVYDASHSDIDAGDLVEKV